MYVPGYMKQKDRKFKYVRLKQSLKSVYSYLSVVHRVFHQELALENTTITHKKHKFMFNSVICLEYVFYLRRKE